MAAYYTEIMKQTGVPDRRLDGVALLQQRLDERRGDVPTAPCHARRLILHYGWRHSQRRRWCSLVTLSRLGFLLFFFPSQDWRVEVRWNLSAQYHGSASGCAASHQHDKQMLSVSFSFSENQQTWYYDDSVQPPCAAYEIITEANKAIHVWVPNQST